MSVITLAPSPGLEIYTGLFVSYKAIDTYPSLPTSDPLTQADGRQVEVTGGSSWAPVLPDQTRRDHHHCRWKTGLLSGGGRST